MTFCFATTQKKSAHWTPALLINFKNSHLTYITPASGIAACFFIAFGILASSSHYTRSTIYSPKNHFISELGLATASEYSFVFNICIGIGGVLLVIFNNGLGNYLCKSPLAWYAAYIGMGAALSFSAIGYFTADNWHAHRTVALVFFSGVMISVVLFSYCLWLNKQGKLHHFIGMLCFIITFIYFVVLFWPKVLLIQLINHPENFVRPELWGLAVLEWTYCLFIGSWILTVSADLIYILNKKEKL